MNKVIPLDRFLALRKSINKRIILVGGCFDVFHYGHLVFLKNSKAHGDMLVVLLESDGAILKKKKHKPVHSQIERAEILAAIEFVDYVIQIGPYEKYEEYMELVRKIKPAVIAVTKGDPQLDNKKKQAEAVGGEVIVVTDLVKKFQVLI